MTIREAMMLTLATTYYRHLGRMESDMRDLTGYPPTVFWLKVNELIDRADCVAAMPMETARLRRRRDALRAARSGLRAG